MTSKEVEKVSIFWIIDPKTKSASASLTFATIAFLVAILSYLASVIAPFLKMEYIFDAGAISTFVLPSMMLYFARKHTDTTKTKTNENVKSQENE